MDSWQPGSTPISNRAESVTISLSRVSEAPTSERSTVPMRVYGTRLSLRMPGGPRGWSKVWEAPDRKIGEPGENGEKVVSHRDSQPAAAFHDRENRRNLRSRLWAADVQPILPVMYTCT